MVYYNARLLEMQSPGHACRIQHAKAPLDSALPQEEPRSIWIRQMGMRRAGRAASGP